MIRTFHSIGQGAFYTEKFDDLTMVYDCGGSRKEIIEHEIQNTFEEGQTVDKLFISHFHNDHINGLKFLLSYCNVQIVYLPLLHEKLEVQFLIENVVFGNGDSFIDRLIKNPVDTIRERNKETRVIRVKPGENDLKEESSDTLIASGTEIVLDNSIDDCTWVFIPYNFQYDNLNTQLCVELENNGIDISNIVSELITDKNKIIAVYKTVLGGTRNFNANSLVLYSGPKENNECDIYIQDAYSDYCIPCFWHCRLMYPGCLYLGDYNVSDQSIMDDLKSEYSVYWNSIGTIQIPHHGSEHNFHSDLVSCCTFSIMSAGRGNRYNHPHASTVKDIVMKRSIPVLVTEEDNTTFIQEVLKYFYICT